MKVLLINNARAWGGGQEHLKDLALELRANGVEVHFVVRRDSINETNFGGLGFKLHLMPYRHGKGTPAAFLSLVSLLRRERFDVVSINREHDLLLTVLAYKAAFPLRRHGRLMMSYHLPTVKRQPLLGSCDAVVCISEHVRDQLMQGAPGVADRTHILYYGIRLPDAPGKERFDDRRVRTFFTGRAFPVIGMVGEFWKNQIDLVEMLPRLREVFPQITLAFIGNNRDEGLTAPLKARARELGVEENVIYTGHVPRERIGEVFQDLDLSVSTHRNEGFGIVHLESLAAGTPVVAYNSGGLVDIFKGEDVGALVDGGVAEFAEVLISLLRDPARRFSLGEEGHHLIDRRYSVRAMGRTYMDFYARLVE